MTIKEAKTGNNASGEEQNELVVLSREEQLTELFYLEVQRQQLRAQIGTLKAETNALSSELKDLDERIGRKTTELESAQITFNLAPEAKPSEKEGEA